MSPSELRYHIASLAAVFLALGMGILIGTAFVGAPVVDRQTRLIRGLENSVSDLRRETAERQGNERALQTLLPLAVRGKLSGGRVLVIQTGFSADAANQAADAVRLAGASVVEHITLPADAWRQAGDVPAASPPPLTAASGEDRFSAVATTARRLGVFLATGSDSAAGADFRQRGLLIGGDRGDSSLPNGPLKYAVLVGGAEGAAANAGNATEEPWATVLARSVDLPLAESLAAHGVTVVGTEPREAGVSFMRLYQSAGMATIDDIDRAVGKLCLPFALTGEKANYGLKPTADRLLPFSLETKATEAKANAANDNSGTP